MSFKNFLESIKKQSLKGRFSGYIFSVCIVATLVLIRFVLHAYFDIETSMLAFIFPVLVTALLFGLKAGIFSTFLSIAAGIYFLFHLQNQADYVRLFIFLSQGIFLSFLGEFIIQKDKKLTEAVKKVSASHEAQKKADDKVRSLEADLARVWRVNTLGEMATGLAHELSQPIVSIKNYSSALERLVGSTADDIVIGAVKSINFEAERASSFIHSLRSFIGSRRPDKNLEDINEVISDISLLVKNELDSNHIKMKLDLAEPGIRVPMDKIQFIQVILNLFRNSIESMTTISNGDKEIFVGSSIQDNGVLLCVSDTGCGIPSTDMKRIFDPFFTTKKSGMGMGLAISRSVIELHEGKIWSVANEPKGTTFLIWLPMKAV